MCDKDKGEHNYVADALNWEQRVSGELESARIWETHWGDLYSKGNPRDYEGKIKRLQEEINNLPVATLMTNSQMSWQNIKPYQELCGKKTTIEENGTDTNDGGK